MNYIPGMQEHVEFLGENWFNFEIITKYAR